jgi:hypothetical protein
MEILRAACDARGNPRHGLVQRAGNPKVPERIGAVLPHPIAAIASISISQPGRASRVTVTSVDGGGFSTLT